MAILCSFASSILSHHRFSKESDNGLLPLFQAYYHEHP